MATDKINDRAGDELSLDQLDEAAGGFALLAVAGIAVDVAVVAAGLAVGAYVGVKVVEAVTGKPVKISIS